MRPARTAAALVLLAAATLGAGAPATSGPASTSGSASTSAPTAATGPATATGPAGTLTVTYDPGTHDPLTYPVQCDPARSTAVCGHLDGIGGPAGPVPRGTMCSMVYGGPQTARVTGLWRGRTVRETYRRTNGCEVARWNRMVPVLPAPLPAGEAAGTA